MTAGEGPPQVVPSAVDPDCDCVLVDPAAATAPPGPASPGDRPPLCPPGYVPRRRASRPYDLHGKQVVRGDAPEENPEPPPRP